jgi:hypothetical protein
VFSKIGVKKYCGLHNKNQESKKILLKEVLIKRLLKKYDSSPEGTEDVIKIIIKQCELWTDNFVN